MNKAPIVATAITLVIMAVGGYFIFHNPNNDTANSSESTSTTPAADSSTAATDSSSDSSNSTSNNDTTKGATITYSDSGFSPATLTVKAGTKVNIKNTSSSTLQFDSDPHPQHTDDPELNINIVSPGQSVSFTPTVKGTHGYHNHLNANDTGILIVQ